MLLNLITNVAAGIAKSLSTLRMPTAVKGLGSAILNPQEAFALTMDTIANKNIAAAIALEGTFALTGAGFAAGMWYSTMARNTIFPPRPLPFQSKGTGGGVKGPIMTANGPQFKE